VHAVFTTPTYHDYHWLAGPDVDKRFGAGFTDKITRAMLALSPDVPDQAHVLELYGAHGFVTTTADSYTAIEEIGRKRKLIG
jgi:phosphonate transport system substrate-binding protein